MDKKILSKIGYIILGTILFVLIFLLFGIPTALVPTPFFARMITIKAIDYIFLFLNSVLLASYFTLSLVKKNQAKQPRGYLAFSGTLFGVFSFSCPLCSVILVAIFSTTAIITYFEPLRPWLGIISVTMLSLAVYYQVKRIYSPMNCITCEIN